MAPLPSFNQAEVLRIVFIGPPGAGKGTQCSLLSKQLDVPHISTGEMLRSLEGSDGSAIHAEIDRGHFAPDEYVLRMIHNRLAEADCQAGYLLDGFPRTLVQAKAFHPACQTSGHELTHVIELQVDHALLRERLSARNRRETRADDSEAFVTERFEIYRERTKPVLDFYATFGLVRRVKAHQDAATVNQSILDLLQS